MATTHTPGITVLADGRPKGDIRAARKRTLRLAATFKSNGRVDPACGHSNFQRAGHSRNREANAQHPLVVVRQPERLR